MIGTEVPTSSRILAILIVCAVILLIFPDSPALAESAAVKAPDIATAGKHDPIGSKLQSFTGSDTAVGDRFGWSIDLCGDLLVVGAWANNSPLSNAGAAYIFARNQGGPDNWGEVVKLVASDAEAEDRFGWSVAVDGDTVAVGAIEGGDTDGGSVYIFKRNHGGADAWGQVARLVANIDDPEVNFGWAVDISGDTLAVGAPDYENWDTLRSGSWYIFERNHGGADAWGQVFKVNGRHCVSVMGIEVWASGLGRSISLDGDVLLVGAPDCWFYETPPGPYDPPCEGEFFGYHRNHGGAGAWGEVLEFDVCTLWYSQAKHVAVDRNKMVSSTPGCSFSAFIGYRTADSEWGEWGFIGGYHGNRGDLAIENDTIVVPGSGSPDSDVSVEVRRQNRGGGGHWGIVAEYFHPEIADEFGESVTVHGRTLAIGARRDDAFGVDAGSVFMLREPRSWWQEVTSTTGTSATDGDEYGVAVAIDGTIAVIGARYAASDAGAAYVLMRNEGGTDAWGEKAVLTAPAGQAGDHFGGAVAVDRVTAVVGAELSDAFGSDSGAAFLYHIESGLDQWGLRAQLTAPAVDAGDSFGCSVDVSGTTAVVGAKWDDPGGVTDAGSATIFERNGGGMADAWAPLTVQASDRAPNDWFGHAVAIDRDTIVVGAYGSNSPGQDSGAAYVFHRNQGGAEIWGQVTKIVPNDSQAGDRFGISVAIVGDTMVVGANQEDSAGDSAGAAYVFQRNTSGADSWGQVAKLVAQDGSAMDLFGWAVAIDHGKIVVSAYQNDDACPSDPECNSGSAYVFERNSGGADAWRQTRKLVYSEAALGDRFGRSLAVSGDFVLVGVYKADSVFANSGTAVFFHHSDQIIFMDGFESGDLSAW